MRKVIFHVDENTKWPLALTNLENLVAALEKGSYEIRVLANGPAVNDYTDMSSENAKRMNDLNSQGVTFLACQNALDNFDLKAEDLYDFVEVVPAGVIELIDKQAEGFAYICP